MNAVAGRAPVMPKTPNEWFYERTLKSKLAKLKQLCQKRGLSLIVSVQIDPGNHGRTTVSADNVDLGMTLLHAAGAFGLKIDHYLLWCADMVERERLPHSSAFLTALGVEQDPAQRKPRKTPLTIPLAAPTAEAPAAAAAETPPVVEEPAPDPRSIAGKPTTFKEIPYAGEGPAEAANDVAAAPPAAVAAENGDGLDIPAFLRRAKPDGYDINADI